MPDKHVKFHSVNGKRQVLVVDDEPINRAILEQMLEEQYDIITAENGAEALARIEEKGRMLSLILLDLILPDIHGLEILRRLRADSRYAQIPVIVMTADREAEVESLAIGAIDFIPKPYPAQRVVLARILRTIELFEDRDIIRNTERDQLTGLYNRDFFYRYAEQLDTYHQGKPMDAIVLDVSHFHMVNERYGRAYGDEVLRTVGQRLLEIAAANDCIVGRKENDTFLTYCPHCEDPALLLERISKGLDSRIRLRMGVYADVDKRIDVERRFDRAKSAADTVRNSFSRVIAIYDNALHESELFAEQLLEDFERAVAEHEFIVYYQPKYDIRPAVPVLASAEALVRWRHPTLGMISPGVFIPLFESNGLIQRLDSYVWQEAARQLRDWKTRLGYAVPISVNVSRIDMFDENLLERFRTLMAQNQLRPDEFLLEITESAYTQNSEQMIRIVNALREAGFRIEMDDFGTGYSSLNMISSLPVDALKLDMQFIRTAFRERKDTRMLKVVIDIAESLNVLTIAEGVETAEQMLTLKAMGCDIAQGYYFSRPVPAAEFEQFLIEHGDRRSGGEEAPAEPRDASAAVHFTYDALHDPQTGLYNHSGYELLLKDADPDHIALLLLTIDGMPALRAGEDRAAADRAIDRVAAVLRANFRSVDYVCRISRDEFVIIMTRVTSEMREMLMEKMVQLNGLLAEGEDPLSLSAGIAFGDRPEPQGDLFHDAETALNQLKERGESGYAFF